MKNRRRIFTEGGAVDIRLLRENLGLAKYRKTRERDPEKRRLLLEIALNKIRQAEVNDYQPRGFRRRRLHIIDDPGFLELIEDRIDSKVASKDLAESDDHIHF